MVVITLSSEIGYYVNYTELVDIEIIYYREVLIIGFDYQLKS
jgi:hypothetical protein